ncbi:hypothetical protein TNCV_4034281 [Trichonephila clavipes]|nr:hypothetical protein TNCV_4034281 [Trichonephila clavipes]
MKPLLLQQAKRTTPAISYLQDRERRIESSIQSPVKFNLLTTPYEEALLNCSLLYMILLMLRIHKGESGLDRRNPA